MAEMIDEFTTLIGSKVSIVHLDFRYEGIVQKVKPLTSEVVLTSGKWISQSLSNLLDAVLMWIIVIIIMMFLVIKLIIQV